MKFKPTNFEGLILVESEPKGDERGWFARTFCKEEFKQIGHTEEWLQTNHSYTQHSGTIRGIHYQLPPYQEIKLVRCIAGSVFDVVVDIRKNSSTFLQWFSIELSATNKKAIYIPKGFAHGFQTLSNDCELIYYHTQFYTPNSEAAIRYNDEMINIKWPLLVTDMSDKDKSHPLLTKDYKGI
ncbi:MAG: dTDP-4-dehydrorhamnose 3,5-epimerase [Bacteroidota bacterium]|nr:dTDP-4-dehydrorhamnose 3,5-epimerase [Bacteroidota bacterium]